MAWSESTPVRGIPPEPAGVGRNYFKTGVLMAFLIAVLAIGGQVWGGSSGMLIFGMIGLVINFVSYWFSDRIALMAHRAQPVTREQVPQLYEIVERLTRKAGMPMPKLYVIPSETPNAFATGRNPSHAAVVVPRASSSPRRRELEGVLAHELSHVQNRDILISTIAAAVAGIISSLGHAIQWGAMFGGLSRRDDEGRGGGLEMLAWAILRRSWRCHPARRVAIARDGADASGAASSATPSRSRTRSSKLERGNGPSPTSGGPATAHLFIVNPFGGAAGAMMDCSSTHPPVGSASAACAR